MDTRPSAPRRAPLPRLAVVGRGRLGGALTRALRDAGAPVSGPHGRGFDGAGADVVLLCVPDAAIAAAAATIAPGPIVGHCSGATTLAPLAPHEALSLHPLMTVPGPDADLRGAPCAIAGSTPRARDIAGAIAATLGMDAFAVADDDRAAYHAAASVAANYLQAVEALAERLATSAGVPREALAPLARVALERWLADGPAALTGPVARGDAATVARQRDAVAERLPSADLALFDALTAATERVAASRDGALTGASA